MGRIAQLNTGTDIVPLWDYFMTDALGSVRQMTDTNGAVTFAQAYDPYGFTYNGLGDRLQQTVNAQTTTYTLDLNAGLTQVLDESAPQGYGTNSYIYGLGRISHRLKIATAFFVVKMRSWRTE
jgi:hypothetical protein